MARRRGRGRGRSSFKNALAAAILAAAIGTLASLGFFVLHEQEKRGSYDSETFCPLDGSERHTAILIDASDTLSPTQVNRVIDHVDGLRRDLDLHEWVGLYVLDEDDISLPQPVFALCNPGSGAQANPLYENPERVRRQFEQKFSRPLAEAVESLATDARQEQSTSPILEMIRAVATDRRFSASSGRRLLVVSDMLQNMPAYSQYGGDFDFDAFRRLPYAEQFLNVSLLEVDVELIYLKRAHTARLQTRGHIDFWESYFDAVDASLNRVEPVL